MKNLCCILVDGRINMRGKYKHFEFYPSFDAIGSLFMHFPPSFLSQSLRISLGGFLLIRSTSRVSTIKTSTLDLLLSFMVIAVDGRGLQRFQRIFQRLKEDVINFLRKKGNVAEVISQGLTIGPLLLHFSSNIIIIVLFLADRPCHTPTTALELLHLRDLKDSITSMLTAHAGTGGVKLVLGHHLDDRGGILKEQAFIEVLSLVWLGGHVRRLEVVPV